MESENKEILETENETVENETPQPATEIRCLNCQALLGEEQSFCPECGASLKKNCQRCGAQLQEGQAFCPSCGQKAGDNIANNNMDIEQFNAEIVKCKIKKKITPIILGLIGICAVAIYFASTIFMNPQHYIEKGDYQKAYSVAKEEIKEDVLRENIVAVISADCVDSLKDSASFELRDAWIRVNDSSKVIILQVAANNSYGNKVVNYWYYSYDKEDKEYSLFTNFANFNEEKSYSWDDSSEKLEKALNNLAKITAKKVMSDGVKIKDESIDNINKLFEKDVLENVTLLDEEPQKTE